MQKLGYAKSHHKITPREKWVCPWFRELPKILKFAFNMFFATAEANDFKFGMQFAFSKAHHKITPRGKSGRGPGLGELPKIWGFLLIFLQRLKVATSRLAGQYATISNLYFIIMLIPTQTTLIAHRHHVAVHSYADDTQLYAAVQQPTHQHQLHQ